MGQFEALNRGKSIISFKISAKKFFHTTKTNPTRHMLCEVGITSIKMDLYSLMLRF